jgi:hypothetical protein
MSTGYSDERPIKQTKGKYNFGEVEDNSIVTENQEVVEADHAEDEKGVKSKVKLKKQALQKRNMYDPRKAVEEEKRRKRMGREQLNTVKDEPLAVPPS